MTGSRRRARTAGRRSPSTCCRSTSLPSPIFAPASTTRPSCGRRRFWEKLYEPLIRRAAGLGRAAGRKRSRPLREGLRALRRAGDRRRPGRPVGGAGGRPHRRARHPLRRGFPARRPAPGGRREIDGQPARDWVAQALAELAGLPDVRIMPRTTVFGVYDHGIYGAVERVSDHLPVPPAHQPRQRLWRIVAKRAVLAAGAHRAADRLRRQRPPGVMLARRRADLSQPLRRAAGRRPSSSPPATTAGRRRATSRGRRRRSPPSSIRAESVGARSARWPASSASRLSGAVDRVRGGRRASARSRLRSPAAPRAHRRATCSPSRTAGTRRCL